MDEMLPTSVAAKEAVQDAGGDCDDRGQCGPHGPNAADGVPRLLRLSAVSGTVIWHYIRFSS